MNRKKQLEQKGILILKESNEKKRIEFELKYLSSLSLGLRFMLILTVLVILSALYVWAAPSKTVWSFSSFGDDDYLYNPSDIEVDQARSLIYIADSGNNRVLVFDFDGGAKCFGLLHKNRLVYAYEDSDGELFLKCIEY